METVLKNITLVALAISLSSFASATVAPPGQSEFNVRCPARRLCPEIESRYQACRTRHNQESCDAFVTLFRQLAPEYDCQRSFDHTPKADYIVPAVWLCDELRGSRENEASALEDYAYLLQSLKSVAGRCFFGSNEFRSVLDGHLGEEFEEPSLRAGKNAKRLNCPSAVKTEAPR